MTNIDIELKKLHDGQLDVKLHQVRYKVVCAGRRWGKNVLMHDFTFVDVMKGKTVGWGSPTYKNLEKDWQSMVELLRPVTAKKSEDLHSLELVTGGALEFWSLETVTSECVNTSQRPSPVTTTWAFYSSGTQNAPRSS